MVNLQHQYLGLNSLRKYGVVLLYNPPAESGLLLITNPSLKPIFALIFYELCVVFSFLSFIINLYIQCTFRLC